MIDIQTLIDDRNIGASFAVTANHLGISPEAFHLIADRWIQEGGGDRFNVEDKPAPHKLNGRWDTLFLRRQK